MRASAPARGLVATWLDWLKQLYTGYFASVMATGIVATALLLFGATVLSAVLLVIACVLLVFFTVVYLLRLALYPRQFIADLRDPTSVFGFFTFVVGVGLCEAPFAQCTRLAYPPEYKITAV